MMSSLSSSRKAVLGIFFITGSLLSSWIPHIPIIQEKFGQSEGLLGFALLSMAIGAIISMSIGGILSSRFGSRKVTIFSAFAFCFSLPLPILAPSFHTFVIALYIFGACNGAMDIAMNAQAVGVEKKYNRPIMSAFHGFFSIGGLLGLGVLAFLVLVAEGSVADWSSVYIKQALQTGPRFVAAGYAAFSLMMAVGRLWCFNSQPKTE